VLTGIKSEGVVGITFRATGPIAQPQVLVNPLSIILPGAFRGLAEMGPSSFRVIPRDEKAPVKAPLRAPQALPGGDAIRQTPAGAPRVTQPEVSGSWSTGVEPKKK
jgi:hypothetical protein